MSNTAANIALAVAGLTMEDMNLRIAKLIKERDEALAKVAELSQPAPASTGRDALSYGPVHVVADLVRNLLTLDQSAPIYSAFHVDHQGQRRCRTRGVMTSWERVIDGKWVDPARTDVPYAVIVWAKPEQDEAAPVAARELDVEAERLPVLKINMAQAGVGERAHGYVNGWNDCVDEFARSAAQSTAPVSTDQAGDALLPEPSPLYFQALELVRDAERASVSMVQRRLRIGWDAARDLIELMLMRSEIPEEWAPQFASVVRAPSPNNSPAGRKSD
jgi:hypothetical protein